MSYSASDINALLRDYLKTPEGKQLLKDNKIKGKDVVLYTEQELYKIADDCKRELIRAYTLAIGKDSKRDVSYYFNSNTVKVTSTPTGATITFDDKSLFRPSLVYNGHSTGVGVRDIFALINSGTDRTDLAYGAWTHMGNGKTVIVKGKMPRPAKPFIRAVIERFKKNNPNLTIEYPDDWK